MFLFYVRIIESLAGKHSPESNRKYLSRYSLDFHKLHSIVCFLATGGRVVFVETPFSANCELRTVFFKFAYLSESASESSRLNSASWFPASSSSISGMRSLRLDLFGLRTWPRSEMRRPRRPRPPLEPVVTGGVPGSSGLREGEPSPNSESRLTHCGWKGNI